MTLIDMPLKEQMLKNGQSRNLNANVSDPIFALTISLQLKIILKEIFINQLHHFKNRNIHEIDLLFF